ncbi:MAG: cytochrome c-type biogenesis protein [Alphaproteobacteria bacterium]
MIAALFYLAALVAPLADPAQEARARALEEEIRCVACQNEPISQSTADIAVDMRKAVRERIAAGDNDDRIRTYFSDRYGDFVLFRPPVKPETWALWIAPFVLLALGAGLAWRARGTPPTDDAPVEDDI